MTDFPGKETRPPRQFEVRDGVFVKVDRDALSALGYDPAAFLGRPFTSLLAVEEREKLCERSRRRQLGEAVPSDYETVILAADGSPHVIAVRASLEGDIIRLSMRDVSDSLPRRERLLALARIGGMIQGERSDEAILRILGQQLSQVGIALAVVRPVCGQVVLESLIAPDAFLSHREAGAGAASIGLPRPWPPVFAQAWRDHASFCDDAPLLVASMIGGPRAEIIRHLMQQAGMTRVVCVRIDVGEAPHLILGLCGDWMRDEDVAAFRLFGAQVSAALDSVRSIANLSRKNSELAALNRLAALARTAPDLSSLFSDGTVEIIRSFACENVSFFLVDNVRRELVSAHDSSGRLGPVIRVRLAEADGFSRVARDGEPGLWHVQDFPEPLRTMLVRLGLELVISVPLMARSTVVGVLNLGFAHVRDVEAAEIDFLLAMGSYFGSAVESQQLLEDLRGRVAELTLVHEAGRSLTNTLELEEALAMGALHFACAVEAPQACIWLADHEQDALVLRAAFGQRPGLLGKSLPLSAGDGFLETEAFLVRRAVAIEDADGSPRVDGLVRDLTCARACLAVPLVVRDRAIGVATIIETRAQRSFSSTEIERGTTIANQLAFAIDNALLYEDLRHSYDELARTQAQLVETERLAALGELAAVVAHEVRNPLSVMFNSVVSLRRSVGANDDALRLLEILEEEADHLNRIVGDLLDFARPSVPNLSPEPLDRVLEEAIRAALSNARSAITLRRDIQPTLPHVPMDMRLLKQALLNVVLNAVQAMPYGGTLSVAARSERLPSGAEQAVIAVSDSGLGISPEARERMFEPFFTTKASGTGLGLAVVKRIVKGHRGDIDIASEPGVGTTVTIRLPLRQSDAAGDSTGVP